MAEYNIYPTKFSLFRSLAYDLLPVPIFVLVVIKVAEKFGWLAGGFVVVFGVIFGVFYLLPQILMTIRVHKWKVTYDDKKISIVAPNGQFVSNWSQITKATLRERKNLISWTDRVLVLENNVEKSIWLNVSTFSQPDIEKLLNTLQKHISISKIYDSKVR